MYLLLNRATDGWKRDCIVQKELILTLILTKCTAVVIAVSIFLT